MTYKPEDLILMALNCDPDNEAAVISMLRAGAQAMKRVQMLEGALEIQGGEMMTAIDKAVKAEARVKELEGLLKDCADGLSEYVETYYFYRKQYPSELRRYERDIEPVVKARAALGEKP